MHGLSRWSSRTEFGLRAKESHELNIEGYLPLEVCDLVDMSFKSYDKLVVGPFIFVKFFIICIII